MNKKITLRVGWLYPTLMSTYGDRGNILVLEKRCALRGIALSILRIEEETPHTELKDIDIIFGGGAQDREQEIVMRDLRGKKGEQVKRLIDNDVPALFVCGSPQLMGNYYEPAEGKRIEGVGIFDMVSKHPGPKADRLIGNIVATVAWENLSTQQMRSQWQYIVGFENHGGRTYLGNRVKPFAKVIKGFGNNGEDGTEGVVYKNAIGCYFHGPLLPKNPQIADWIIERAIAVKYQETFHLDPIDDTLAWKAHEAIVKRLGVPYNTRHEN
jgi:lipid II isoglutaminyl synthase (glutamine-hydrolysing)